MALFLLLLLEEKTKQNKTLNDFSKQNQSEIKSGLFTPIPILIELRNGERKKMKSTEVRNEEYMFGEQQIVQATAI